MLDGRTFTIAANQGSMGGGEVMLFAIAEAARASGRDVTVVAPASPDEVVVEATQRGFRVVAIDSASTLDYLRNLRKWDARHRQGLLWCNGLRPAFATAGHPNRVVELHQRPEGKLKALASIATRGIVELVVPSYSMAEAIPGATVLWNWSEQVQRTPRPVTVADRPVTIGFLGRLSSDKGVVVLSEAMAELERRQPGRFRLLAAGESRFVDAEDAQRVDEALAQLGDQVERPGWMPRDDFFNQIDLAVFPSVWEEPFGLVVTEAMSGRVPFVVSDAGALAEVAGDAWVAESNNAVALADVIEQAGQDVGRYVESSYQRWEKHFSPESGQRRVATLLDKLDPSPAEVTGPPKVALAHDYLTQRGGAERVALTLTGLFPQAPLVTSVYDPAGTYPEFAGVTIQTSFLNRCRLLRKHFRIGLPLYGLAFDCTPVPNDADVVVASSTGFAHGIKTPPGTAKIVYCHSPARFLYLVEDYLGRPWWKSLVGWVLMALRPALIAWDRRAAQSADLYLCNSTVVRERIRDVYGFEAQVLHPPASLDPAGEQEPIALDQATATTFHLVVSRLMPYKNVDLVIEAFKAMPDRHLLIIGRGPLGDDLRKTKPANVTMAEGLTDAQMRWAYAHAEAVIAPSREDFGLTPIEGFRFGTPAIALRAGGYLDTVVEGVSGWFFEEASAKAIRRAVDRAAEHPLDQASVMAHAEKFTEAAFGRGLNEAITAVLARKTDRP